MAKIKIVENGKVIKEVDLKPQATDHLISQKTHRHQVVKNKKKYSRKRVDKTTYLWYNKV